MLAGFDRLVTTVHSQLLCKIMQAFRQRLQHELATRHNMLQRKSPKPKMVWRPPKVRSESSSGGASALEGEFNSTGTGCM